MRAENGSFEGYPTVFKSFVRSVSGGCKQTKLSLQKRSPHDIRHQSRPED